MKIVLFEDEQWANFAPLVYARPMFDVRCGAFTPRERIEALVQCSSCEGEMGQHSPPLARFAAAVSQHHAHPEIAGLCRSHLMGYYGPAGGSMSLLSESSPLLFINGRALSLDWLDELMHAPLETVFVSDGALLGAYLSPSLSSAVFYYLREQQTADALDELRRFARIVEDEAVMVSYPWDLITCCGDQVVRDAPILACRLPRLTSHDSAVTRHGTDIYCAESAQLDGPLVLDARDGPVLIDERAHIEPFSFIQGPTYIGANTLVSSALVRGETSIGPVCRVGGEVEASIIQAYSNKHHEGFLGHSWLGEWVNIGAMTTNSDLKNTYGNIRVSIEEIGNLDSGVLKLGTFLADHVKLGIGLHMTGGSIIGIGSNIYGIHMVPKNVPPFTWGGEVFREYRIDSMIDVTRKVMGRRKQVMSPDYEAMLRAVFEITRLSRDILFDVVAHPAHASRENGGEAKPEKTTGARYRLPDILKRS